MQESQVRTWAEVNLSNLEHNYLALRELLPRGCRFLGVIKSNAYGHGAVRVGKKLEELGAEYLGVACLEEAAELRRAGIGVPILILGHTPVEFAGELLKYNLTQTVFDLQTAEVLSQAAVSAGKKLKVHIKADTGMSRLGVLCNEENMDEAAGTIAQMCTLDGLDAEGIFTHFSVADSDEEYTMMQFTRFLTILDKLQKRGVTFRIRHCASSAAVLKYPCTHMDMVRPGIALYGHYPADGMEELCPLLPVMEVKTRIADVRRLPAGTSVSYGRTCELERDSTLAVLPIGYADGFFRLFSNRLEVLVHGQKARITGRICMDFCMADVTDIPGVKQGDVATVYGRDGDGYQPIEAGAEIVGTIQYELLCAVSPRVPRIYV